MKRPEWPWSGPGAPVRVFLRGNERRGEERAEGRRFVTSPSSIRCFSVMMLRGPGAARGPPAAPGPRREHMERITADWVATRTTDTHIIIFYFY